jgi:hypothetical protein
VPCIPLPIINADDNFGYSLGIKLTKECKDMIKEFNPTLFHFTVPDFLALDALRWAKQEVRPLAIHEAHALTRLAACLPPFIPLASRPVSHLCVLASSVALGGSRRSR